MIKTVLVYRVTKKSECEIHAIIEPELESYYI